MALKDLTALLNSQNNLELLKDKGVGLYDLINEIQNGVDEYISVPLSSANILAMFATPVDLIAAPGAGKHIVVKKIVIEMTRTATAYANGGVVTIQYSGGAVVHDSSMPASIVTTGGAGLAINELNPSSAANGVVVPTNTKITITNGTAAFITGTGTMIVKIWYKTITQG